MQTVQEVTNNTKHLSDSAIVLRKMRQLKCLTRKQAGVIFNLTFKTIEKLENGRGQINEQRLATFAKGYGFDLDDLMKIRTGRFARDLTLEKEDKKEKDPLRRDRRFCTPQITKECKILRQLRIKRGISQYILSEKCGWDKRRVGFYECGRKNLNENLILTMLKAMGYTFEEFKQHIETDEMPYEIIEECIQIMQALDTKTLGAVRSFLKSFTS